MSRWSLGRVGSAAFVMILAAAAIVLWAVYGRSSPTASETAGPSHLAAAPTTAPPSSLAAPATGETVVSVPKEKLEAFNLQTEAVRRGVWAESVRVTGRLELNESRVAHISPLVEGVVREVCVNLGQDVKEGEMLATVDSREVGEAKLKLVEHKLGLEFAKSDFDWNQTIYENTTSLLAALQDGRSIQDIQEEFHDRPIGNYREKLVSAAARRAHAAADYQRIHALQMEEIVPQKETIRAKAEYDSANASYEALVEQIKFDCRRQLLLAEQRLKEAQTAYTLGRSQLLIFGFRGDEVDAMDPIGEGERVAVYVVRAPFDGTIVGKHAVLSEHVDTSAELFELADLSTVWLRADVFEKDLGAIPDLRDKTVTFWTASYPQRPFTAKVFSLGSIVDDTTRAVRLLATADNRDRRLKPGMFVEIELPLDDAPGVLQVPAAAIQRHEDLTFVFVQRRETDFERRDVALGRSTAKAVEIVAGLEEGESVVVQGGFALKSEMLSELMAEE
jgi:cobalt-zinc-cadmium efflux system membrane fusion protein